MLVKIRCMWMRGGGGWMAQRVEGVQCVALHTGGTVQDCIMAWISPHSSIWVSNINVTSDASFGMKNNQKLKRA